MPRSRRSDEASKYANGRRRATYDEEQENGIYFTILQEHEDDDTIDFDSPVMVSYVDNCIEQDSHEYENILGKKRNKH